jgi:hypothetical protein
MILSSSRAKLLHCEEEIIFLTLLKSNSSRPTPNPSLYRLSHHDSHIRYIVLNIKHATIPTIGHKIHYFHSSRCHYDFYLLNFTDSVIGRWSISSHKQRIAFPRTPPYRGDGICALK